MPEEEVSPVQIPFLEPPKDLHELYMMTRAEISTAANFHQYYMKLMLLIDVGKEMLPLEMAHLREEASNALTDSKNYPEPRQMERDEGGYRMGTRTISTGLIHVRNEDLSIALEEVKNQQATSLIPILKRIDGKIFRALIECGIVEIKKPTMEELMMDDVMASIQRKIVESQRMKDE